MIHFTPVERCMLDVFADGLPHRRKELHACLMDELGDAKNIRPHLSSIRRKLRSRGEDILCVFYKRTFCYQRVRLLALSEGE